MKPFKKGALLIVLAICSKVHAQKEAVNWVFGDFSGVSFSCPSPQLFQSPFSGLEGGSCISSADGELLFMTNGDLVWSRDFRIMPNGRGLGGLCTNYGTSSSSQSSLIVPHPGNPALYYIFTTDCAEDSFEAGFRYSVVDLTMNGGLGDVIEKNKLLVAPTAEKITAVFQPNGKDVWVVTHGVFNNTFYAFSITSTGLNLTPVISNTGQVHPGGRGYLKFSPDGKRLVATSFIFSDNDGISPEIFSFDDTSGKVTSEFILPAPSKSIYAASFSPNGKLLYMSCSWTCSNPTIEQFNLEAGTPQQIVDQRYTIPALIFGALQLSIDGKLYFMSYDAEKGASISYLSVITLPNVVGAGCNPIETYITLPCWHRYGWGLPNFIESYFKTPVPASATCDPPKVDLVESFDFAAKVACGSLTVNFDNQSSIREMEILFWGQTRMAFSWKLDFGDGFSFTSEQPQDVAHTYAKQGVYTVTLTLLLYNECMVRSMQKVIEVVAVNPVFDYVQECRSLQVGFNNKTLDADNRFIWHWNFGDNSTDSTSNLKNPTHRYAVPGNYVVKLKATFECQLVVRTLNVQVLSPLAVSLGPDATFCAGEQVTLNVGQPGMSYQWSTGHMGETISVADPGTYAVKVSRGICFATDTIRLTYRDCHLCNNPINRLTLGRDTTLCEADLIRLSVDNSISGNFAWSTGSTEQSIDVTDPGKYWVSVAKQNCQASDTVTVSIRDCRLCENPLHELTLGNDTTLCETEPLRLRVEDKITGKFSWSTGSVDRSIDVLDPGAYSVSVKTKYCENSDTVNVMTVDCMQCDVHTTNVMTPNGDEKNDEFTFTAGCEYYNFRMDIYNRWGSHLLSVSSPSWNGIKDGELVPRGIYYFVIAYSFTGPSSRTVTRRTKGWLHVTN